MKVRACTGLQHGRRSARLARPARLALCREAEFVLPLRLGGEGELGADLPLLLKHHVPLGVLKLRAGGGQGRAGQGRRGARERGTAGLE